MDSPPETRHVILPQAYQDALAGTFFRPPPVFDDAQLSTLLNFVTASGIRPEGVGGGRFDISRRPYLKAMYEESRKHPNRRLVIQKAAQTGLTVKLIYRAAWFTADAHRRINTALMFPTLDAVLDLHKSRFRPMMQSSSKMMDLARDIDSIGLVRIGSSIMRFRGMKSGVGIDSFPADVMLFDEVRLMDLATLERAFVRISQSRLEDENGMKGIIELNSTAGFPNMDINRYFERSTQNWWRTPCPNPGCPYHRDGIAMPRHWPDVVGQRSDGSVFYKCPKCDTPIPDEILTREGFYVPENPGAYWDGYQFSQILMGAKMLPELWEAYSRGDNPGEFYNSRLGLSYMDKDAVPASRETVLACRVESPEAYVWPGPSDVVGEWVAMGVDQRAPEKHIVIMKLGEGGSHDLVHLQVLEASGEAAIREIADIARFWHVKILVIDGEPSYDLSVAVARRLPHRLTWLQDYVSDSPQAIEWKDDSEKSSIKRASGEVKYEYRVLLDRYKAMDWALTQFERRRVRLPYDFREKRQSRMVGGVAQVVHTGEEFLSHLENIARATIPRYTKLPTGEQVFSGEVRQIYRHMALDPHFAHAYLYASAGLARQSGGSRMWMTAMEPGSSSAPGALTKPEAAPKGAVAEGPELRALKREIDREVKRTCGNCKHFRALSKGEGLCAHPTNAAVMELRVTEDTPECPLYRRKR